MDSVEKSRIWIAAISVLIMLGALVILGLRAGNTTPNINGDTLGRDSSETLVQYQQRAAASLNELEDQQLHYALISFDSALDDAALTDLLATAAFDDLPRMNAAVIGIAAAVSLPEPTAGATRAAVIRQQIDMQGYPQAPVIGLVIHAEPAQIIEIASLPAVSAVEALPADAIWGHFSVRVHPDAVSSPVISDAFADTHLSDTN